jgi:peptidoglycan hydrolase-like protein with peptidoglycan-binding domain
VRRQSRRDETYEFGGAGRLAAAVGNHPRESVGLLMVATAFFSISFNALFLQNGPHPAPIFATRPVQAVETPAPQPVASVAQPAAAPEMAAPDRGRLISDIQRELNRRGYYDGAVDGIWGAKTDAATRDFVQTANVKVNAEASDGLLRAIVSSSAKAQNSRAVSPDLARKDPIAELIAPSKRMIAIQRALADFGYGQIKPSGNFDGDTRTAIEKFERDHRLPVTGDVSDRFVRELAAMTGRPLE